MADRKDGHNRTLDLLTRIVHQYIVSGHPVGSLFLAEKYHLPMSSATIRSVMVLLEQEGYMYQPHASAGRVPTEEGYRIYIQYMRPCQPSKRQQELLEDVWREDALLFERKVKKMAKALSQLSGEIVFIAFDPNSVYYTGLTHLCEKPEYENRELIAKLSEVIDSLDETVAKMFSVLGQEPEILIGKKDDLSELCSVVLVKFTYNQREGVMGMLGPSRMHYARNVSLLKSTKLLIEDT